MKYLLGLLLLPLPALAVECEVPDALWLQARSAQTFLQRPELKPCWEAVASGGRLQLMLRDDEAARVHGAELAEWLVALGFADVPQHVVADQTARLLLTVE